MGAVQGHLQELRHRAPETRGGPRHPKSLVPLPRVPGPRGLVELGRYRWWFENARVRALRAQVKMVDVEITEAG